MQTQMHIVTFIACSVLSFALGWSVRGNHEHPGSPASVRIWAQAR